MLRWPWASVMSFASTKAIPGAPFFDGVRFAPEGRYSTKLGVSKYRTIWLKNAEFRPLPDSKIPIFCMDFTPPKSAFFDHQNQQNKTHKNKKKKTKTTQTPHKKKKPTNTQKTQKTKQHTKKQKKYLH